MECMCGELVKDWLEDLKFDIYNIPDTIEHRAAQWAREVGE